MKTNNNQPAQIALREAKTSPWSLAFGNKKMTYFDTLSLIISFIGGGIISAVINWIRIHRAEKKDREIKFLDDQIRKLYGPLYFLVSQSEKLLQLNHKFHEAYQEEYCNKKWSKKENTRKILKEECAITLKTANKYMEMIEKNNEKMKEILDSHYPLLDLDDIETFLLFFEDHARSNIEKDAIRGITIPLTIYEAIGDISFLRPEVINRIKTQFFNKKKRRKELLK